MATVKTYKELEKALMMARDKALKGAGEKTKDLVKDEIEKEVYSISPGTYERTGDLKNSMTDFPLENKGNVSQVKIAHDTDKMSYNASKFQHASPYWSPWKYTNYVAETVHDGTSGSLFGENGHWRRPKPYMDNAKKQISEQDESFEDVISTLEANRVTIEKERLEIEKYKEEIHTLKSQLEAKQIGRASCRERV